MNDLPNYIGLATCLLGFALLSFIKGEEPWRISVLIIGCVMVAFAALAFEQFTVMTGLFEILMKTAQISETTNTEAKRVLGVWVFVLPAVVGAIGANLITAWFLAKKPSKSID